MPRKRGNRSPPQEKRSDDDDDFFFDDSSSGKSPHEPQHRNAANARERARMRVLSKAFCRLKTTLPWVPADTKLSKLDTLRLAASYIAHLKTLLHEPRSSQSSPHPLSLAWPFAFQHGGSLSCSISQRWNVHGQSNETNDRPTSRNDNIQSNTTSNEYYHQEFENEYEEQAYEDMNPSQVSCAEHYCTNYGFKDNYYESVRNCYPAENVNNT